MKQDRYLEYRLRVLPEQLDNARRKVAALEREAKRYGMKELLTNPDRLNDAWEREYELARLGK